jgi:hypothetical protein
LEEAREQQLCLLLAGFDPPLRLFLQATEDECHSEELP